MSAHPTAMPSSYDAWATTPPEPEPGCAWCLERVESERDLYDVDGDFVCWTCKRTAEHA